MFFGSTGGWMISFVGVQTICEAPSSSPPFPERRTKEAMVDIDKVFWQTGPSFLPNESAFARKCYWYQQQLYESAVLETLEKRERELRTFFVYVWREIKWERARFSGCSWTLAGAMSSKQRKMYWTWMGILKHGFWISCPMFNKPIS